MGQDNYDRYIKRTNNSVISLPVGVALKIEDDCVEIVGDGPAFVFESSGSHFKITNKIPLFGTKKMLQ